METTSIFSIASTNAQWLSARQATVAGNIANANVTTYKALDTASFADTLNDVTNKMELTNVNHLTGTRSIGDVAIESSGKGVSLEAELAKSSQVRSQTELNTAITSSFHRMLLMTVKP
ncbi:hypothetical protein [Ahrensia marina]|uniref:Flagellar basal body rod protein FlgB n=1 Tax=Ahrensia marina TaxID=1514904 RepID=A0A0N0E729_9HYPH|nr:hypothetical protein [Ahrensia marina]KPB00708.1 hypothetical protein SU32_11835 [Ahrensia marina]